MGSKALDQSIHASICALPRSAGCTEVGYRVLWLAAARKRQMALLSAIEPVGVSRMGNCVHA